MSFDRPNQSPHRSALSPEDHRPGLQQQQQQQQHELQQSSGYHTFTDSFASSPERWDTYHRRPSSSSNNAPSFYSSDPSYAHQTSPLGYSHEHGSPANSWTESSPDRNHTLTSITPDRNSIQQPGQTSPSTSTSSYPPYDPIRNNVSHEEGQMSPTGNGRYLEHSKASSPAMSISQLLSNATPPPPPPSYAPPTSSIPFTASAASNSSHSGAEGQPYFESINPNQSHHQLQDSTTTNTVVSRNGISNLLNVDIKSKSNNDDNNATDSDTDSEDIALVNSHNQSKNAYAGNGIVSTSTGYNNNDSHHQSVPVEEEHGSDISIMDDLSDNEENSHIQAALLNWKSSKYNGGGILSDDDDDGDGGETDDDKELLEIHKHAMVEYMLNIHRRKKAAIDAYESKRTRRQKKMKERLEQLYEKRYGNDMWKLRGGLEIPSALLHKVKQEKDRFKVRRHHGLHRILKKGHRKLLQYHGHDQLAHSDMEDYGSAGSSDVDATLGEMTFLDPIKAKSISPNKLEAERKRIWLDIARTDIPRMARIITRVQATRAGNCKKLAQYCQKEAKRAATKSGRATKDIQLKAKRAQKEMLIFWKKNEKEERELRKKAEREALERLRQEEERREAQRQARKLNFLITQTELYSHFIGRKINKDVTEDEDTAAQADDEPTPYDDHNDESMDIDITANNDDMGEVDFDEDDEDKLKEHARKSAQNALAKQRQQTKAFDEGAKQRRMDANGPNDVNMQEQLDTMNFQEPSSMGSGPEVKQPSILMCQLKSYQLKGLNWLANLYEQGINGILADEMGLGKTVQSISLMAYLAEVHNIWGPFLVIAPASTLHNWQQEISKFVPSFRALPYWGNPKERKILRQSWTRKQLYGRDAPFHIVITSYQLVLTDVNYFQRVKWQYMVLDEAQAIKSSSSARWKLLLGFYCRNRLLLTGTPIQNSMQELWALLHFIMPTLFDSHEEFSEWFSKDIESHAENKGTLNEHQLRRLHMILKPFMLRRIKKNVQHELGDKIEVEVYCDLTARQRQLYRGLKEKISISELLEKATSLSDFESMDSLMNLVMQFRKVCNHPELFERADVESPYAFCDFGESGPLSKEQYLEYSYSTKNKMKYYLPKQVYRHGGVLNVPGPQSNAGFSTRYLDNLMNIWNGDYIQKSMESSENDAAFSFLRFIDTSAQEASYLFKHSLISRWLFHLSRRDQRARRRFYKSDGHDSYDDAPLNTYAKLLITDTETQTNSLVVTSGSPMDELTSIGDKLLPMVKRFDNNFFPGARSVPVDVVCSDISYEMDQKSQLFNPNVISALLGTPRYVNKFEPQELSTLKQVVRRSGGQGIMTVPASGYGYSQMKVPAMRDLILDSGKLAKLDKLLEKLKNEGHRCLIYFQMTRMIDLMEEYIAYKQYKYLRLDGSSKISDRRDMVQDWQTRPEIFIFLLSTRAGGLGINLTAADTVIFYDSDWNPTVDQQAMDRAHRLGQTKQVTVYRLLTKGTIEERILMRAKQKDEIQKVVISGGEFKQVDFKPREIVSLLLDDEELDNKLAQQLKRKAVEEENKKNEKDAKDASRPTKRSKKQGSKESTPAQSPFTVDQLFSAGGDTLPEDESETGLSSKSKRSSSSSSTTDKKSRTGRPRTNFSFTG